MSPRHIPAQSWVSGKVSSSVSHDLPVRDHLAVKVCRASDRVSRSSCHHDGSIRRHPPGDGLRRWGHQCDGGDMSGSEDARDDTIHPNPTRGLCPGRMMNRSRCSSSSHTTSSAGIPTMSSTRGLRGCSSHNTRASEAPLWRLLRPKCRTLR